MKGRKIVLSILTICVIILSCDKDSTSIDKVNLENYFKATVLRKGVDCGNTFLIQFLERNEEIDTLTGKIGPIYYADNLPVEFKKDNMNIRIKFRTPTLDDAYICTALGMAYPHIVVLDATEIL